MAIAHKIAYNVSIITITKVVSIALALYSIKLITNYLGVSGFGEYATVFAFAAFFANFGDFGLYPIVTRKISRKGAPESEIIGSIFLLRIISSLLTILITLPFILALFPYESHVKWGIVFVSISFLFSSSYGVLNSIFQKHLVMGRVAVVELIGKVIRVGLIYYIISIDAGFLMIISAIIVEMLFNFIVLFPLARKIVQFVPHKNFAYWKKFLKASFPMGVAAFVTFLYTKADSIIMSLVSSDAAVGIYNGAYKVVDTMAFFPAMIVGLMLPILSRNIFSEKESFRLAADKTIKTFFLLTVPLIITVLFVADFIITTISSEAFIASADVLRILIFASALIFFGHFFNTVLIAGNKQMVLMIALFGIAILNVGTNIFVIKLFGYTGAAIVSVITELCVVICGAVLTMKYVQYKPKLQGLWRIAGAGAAMATLFYLLQNISQSTSFIIFMIISATCIYITMLWILKAVTKEELKSIFFTKKYE